MCVSVNVSVCVSMCVRKSVNVSVCDIKGPSLQEREVELTLLERVLLLKSTQFMPIF